MRLFVVTISVAMLFFLRVYADVQTQKDFDLQRFSGKWYRVGFAYDSPDFLQYKDRLKIYIGVLTPLENGNANMSMWSQRSSGCVCETYIYEKTAVPGQFTYFSTRHNRIKDITVVETNYTEYAVVLKNKKMNKEFTQVALYEWTASRRPWWHSRPEPSLARRGIEPQSPWPASNVVTTGPRERPRRSHKLRPQLVNKFKEFAMSRGFPEGSILTPEDVDDCHSVGQ